MSQDLEIQQAKEILDREASKSLFALTAQLLITAGMLAYSLYQVPETFIRGDTLLSIMWVVTTLVIGALTGTGISAFRGVICWQKSVESALSSGQPKSFKIKLVQDPRYRRRIKAICEDAENPARPRAEVSIVPASAADTHLGHEINASAYFDGKWPDKPLILRIPGRVLIAIPRPEDIYLMSKRK